MPAARREAPGDTRWFAFSHAAAYGPEAALTVLLPLGAAGIAYILPLSGAVIALLAIVYFSYRQTIAAYPRGAGSYTVAKENLGERAGLVAGAALMIDYLLNVAVGISAGVGAVVSALPALRPYMLPLCLGILALLTVVNLRGARTRSPVHDPHLPVCRVPAGRYCLAGARLRDSRRRGRAKRGMKACCHRLPALWRAAARSITSPWPPFSPCWRFPPTPLSPALQAKE